MNGRTGANEHKATSSGTLRDAVKKRDPGTGKAARERRGRVRLLWRRRPTYLQSTGLARPGGTHAGHGCARMIVAPLSGPAVLCRHVCGYSLPGFTCCISLFSSLSPFPSGSVFFTFVPSCRAFLLAGGESKWNQYAEELFLFYLRGVVPRFAPGCAADSGRERPRRLPKPAFGRRLADS